jgi:hypothetical protein
MLRVNNYSDILDIMLTTGDDSVVNIFIGYPKAYTLNNKSDFT